MIYLPSFKGAVATSNRSEEGALPLGRASHASLAGLVSPTFLDAYALVQAG